MALVGGADVAGGAAKAARSIAAMIFGYLNFDKKLRIIGIILNNVSGPKHAKYLIEACRNSLNVPILGIVRKRQRLENGRTSSGFDSV